MSAFGIFWLCLTIVYLVYYSIIFALDQHGGAGKKKDEAEEFDSPDDTGEVSRRVKENQDGSYTVSDEEPDNVEDAPQEEDPEQDIPDQDDEEFVDQEFLSDDSDEGFVPGDFSNDDYLDDEFPRSGEDESYDPGPADEQPPHEDAGDAGSGVYDDPDNIYLQLKDAIDNQLLTVVPSYEEQYDSTEMYLVMCQPLETQTRIHRERVMY